MKAAPFEYFRPTRIADAIDILSQNEDARPLAGGQSMVPMMNFRFLQPEAVVDLNRIEDLRGVTVEDGAVRIGAMTRQKDLLASDIISEHLPIFRTALSHVGHRQTRARGTIGGSLCHLDPAAELSNLACLYGASFEVAGPDGTRRVDYSDFALGYLTTCLSPGEILVAVRFPVWPSDTVHVFEEFALRHGDYALVAVSVLLAPGPDSGGWNAAIALSGAGDVPLRLTDIEALVSSADRGQSAMSALEENLASLDFLSDPYADGAYRKHLAEGLLRRALTAALGKMGVNS